LRLDLYLAESKLASSRTRAKNLIDLGMVAVNGTKASRASTDIKSGDVVVLLDDYAASLGSIKLKNAFADFQIDVHGKICADIGASNGGFTHVLLENNAKIVYAIDVGDCALPEYLKNDPRVIVMDRTNARLLKIEQFKALPDFAVIDVSFISLELILPSVCSILSNDAKILALIKPQFELRKNALTKQGILKSETLEAEATAKIVEFSKSIGLTVLGLKKCVHPFENKNQEYFILLQK